jgi:hypothetical protein
LAAAEVSAPCQRSPLKTNWYSKEKAIQVAQSARICTPLQLSHLLSFFLGVLTKNIFVFEVDYRFLLERKRSGSKVVIQSFQDSHPYEL